MTQSARDTPRARETDAARVAIIDRVSQPSSVSRRCCALSGSACPAASAALEAQQRGLSRIRQLDWRGETRRRLQTPPFHGARQCFPGDAQVYVHQLFQWLKCSFAQLLWAYLQVARAFAAPPPVEGGSVVSFRAKDEPETQRQRKGRFAKGNERFRKAERKSSNHYERRITHFAGLFVFKGLVALSFRRFLANLPALRPHSNRPIFDVSAHKVA
jgi:hypothetical protein